MVVIAGVPLPDKVFIVAINVCSIPVSAAMLVHSVEELGAGRE